MKSPDIYKTNLSGEDGQYWIFQFSKTNLHEEEWQCWNRQISKNEFIRSKKPFVHYNGVSIWYEILTFILNSLKSGLRRNPVLIRYPHSHYGWEVVTSPLTNWQSSWLSFLGFHSQQSYWPWQFISQFIFFFKNESILLHWHIEGNNHTISQCGPIQKQTSESFCIQTLYKYAYTWATTN